MMSRAGKRNRESINLQIQQSDVDSAQSQHIDGMFFAPVAN